MGDERTLFDDMPLHDGETFQAAFDLARLNEQTRRVYALMADRTWRTLAEIRAVTNDPEASISARLRDLKKERFGRFDVQKRRRGEPSAGLWEYRLMPPSTEVKREPILIRNLGCLRDWVREHLSVKELDQMRCPHCGCGTAAHEVIDLITGAVLATEHPAFNGDWREFLDDLATGGLTDLISE